jgi:beta-lactamase class A
MKLFQFRTAKLFYATVILLSLAIAFYAGWLVGRNNTCGRPDNKIIRLGPEKLVNPLLACEDAEGRLNARQLQPFKKKLEQLIAEKVKSGDLSDAAIYFRDLHDGMTLEINPDDSFEPASLNKIPIMIGYLKLAEKNPALLKKRFTYIGKVDSTKEQYFKPQKTLEPGKTYTVEELLRFMIAYSDNNSWKLLLDNIDQKYLYAVLKDLGVDYKVGPVGEWLVTVKSYAIFMRVLYNTTYLNKEMSEKALEFMTGRNFQGGISSSIPKEIVVANKFGEMGTPGPNGPVRQLHDFGIVYFPDRPYLLSIMTKGDDYGKLANVIHEISKLIYEEFAAQNAKVRH